MDLHLRKRFCSAEDEFLDALGEGEPHLSSYNLRWTSLNLDFTAALYESRVSQQTIDIAMSVASHINSIAECFIKINHEQESATSSMRADIDRILDGISSIDITESHTSTSTPRSSCERELRSDSHVPAYIAPAYEWLLKNLHNPYPAAAVKSEIARTCECSLASINAWFNAVRRRMGWTKLCREHFNNCRADILDAAYRALVQEDPNRTLDPSLIHAFMVIRVTAEDLYSSVFTKSALAGDLDAVVKEMTEETKKLAEEAKRREAEEAKLLKERAREDRKRQRALERGIRKTSTVVDCQPSQRSCSSSPVHTLHDSLTDDSIGDEDALPPVVIGHKRRPGEEADDQSSVYEDRPLKRLRSNSSTDAIPEISVACSSSPPSSKSSIQDSLNDDLVPTTRVVLPTLPSTNITSRKRRLSDAGAECLSKRPRSSIARPRPQAVSDPLPKPTTCEIGVDDWFNENFDSLFSLPSPVDSVVPDLSPQWEIELFNDYSIPHKSTSEPFVLDQTSVSSENSRAAERTFTPISGLVGFDSVLQSIENDSVDTTSKSSKMSSVPNVDSMLPHSVTLPSDDLQSIDWSTLLNGAEDITATAEPMLSQSYNTPKASSQLLPEIDLYMLQLPRASSRTLEPVVLEDPASQQAKLNQLQTMREAVRRMEKEILHEGLSGNMIPLFC